MKLVGRWRSIRTIEMAELAHSPRGLTRSPHVAVTRRPGTAERQAIATSEVEPGRYDSLTRTWLVTLQRSVGNQAVLQSPAIQRALTAGTAFNDLAADADAPRFATIRHRYQHYGQAAAAVNAAQPAGLQTRFQRLSLRDEAALDWINPHHTDNLAG